MVRDQEQAVKAALLEEALAGIGREVVSIADAQHSLWDAELAARHGPGVTRFEDFDVGTFLVSEVAPERLGPKVAEILGVLQANPPLHEAVRGAREPVARRVAAARALVPAARDDRRRAHRGRRGVQRQRMSSYTGGLRSRRAHP